MESIYFLLFCLLNAGIIYWALRHDDYEAFFKEETPPSEGDKSQ